MKMMDQAGYTLTDEKLLLGCVPTWRDYNLRYNVTPESAMIDPSENLMAKQVICGAIPEFSVTQSTKGTEKHMGWFYKEQFIKYVLN